MSLSKGCVLCHQGAKMVLFVTGRCHRSCWYCPLSSERKGTDTVYANEHPVDVPAQVIEEAENMSALGTGITGGEPLLCLDKVTGIAGSSRITSVPSTIFISIRQKPLQRLNFCG